MSTLALDESGRPYLNEAGEFATLNGRDAMEQHLKLKLQSELYGVLSRYTSESIKDKIRAEVHRVVRETEYAERVQAVRVESLDDENTGGYRVEAQFVEVANLSLLLEGL